MSHGFVFLIRPLSLERGFELDCEGIIEEPLRVQRLIEAVIAAAQIGQGLDAEIQILDSEGEVAEVLQLNGSSPFSGSTPFNGSTQLNGSTVATHQQQQHQHLQHA